jgi:hypothetical protein
VLLFIRDIGHLYEQQVGRGPCPTSRKPLDLWNEQLSDAWVISGPFKAPSQREQSIVVLTVARRRKPKRVFCERDRIVDCAPLRRETHSV